MNKKYFIFKEYYVAILSVLLIIIMSLINPNFIMLGNLIEMIKTNAVYFIGSFGVLLVMILGGMDLSIGSMIASISIIVAYLLKSYHISVLQSLIIACILGILFGYTNGILVSKLEVSSVIITFATMSIYRGLIKYLFQVRYILQLPEKIVDFGKIKIIGIPIQIVIIIFIALLTYFILKYTYIGRGIYAIGGNEGQALRRGYNKYLITLFTYSYCGLIAGLCAFVHLTLIGEAYIEGFKEYELNYIIMLVVGGVSIMGGNGNIKGTIFGVAFIILLQNSFTYAHISVYLHKILLGIIILAIVSYRIIYMKKYNQKYLVEYD